MLMDVRGPAPRSPERRPQQTTEPSVRIPQVLRPPAVTEVKAPSGGEAWPSVLLPQQATEPSVLTPQA